MTGTAERAPSVWRAPFVWVTVGAVAIIFLAGMQSLAVTTVMPIVSADLNGAALYAVAFAGPLATSVIGMVAVGAWSDRSGPLLPLTAAVALFVAGLVLAGAASSMEVLVVGRLVQGLGTGGQTVALYVVVARVYPPALHGRVFAAFSAAWVVPSLIGPFLAGVVTEYLHWRWVFFGIAALTTVAYAVVALRLRGTPMHTDTPSTARIGPRLACAVAVAAGALALSLAGALGAWAWVVVAASALVIGVASRPLLPRGTLRAARGLPSVILMRGLIAGALFGAEIYVPYLLIDDYGFSPTWAGLGPHRRRARLGGGGRRPGPVRRPPRQHPHNPHRHGAAGRSDGHRGGDGPGASLAGAADLGLGAGRRRHGTHVPAPDRAHPRVLDPAGPGLQLVGPVDLGFDRRRDLDRGHGARVHRLGRNGCRVPGRVPHRHGAGAPRPGARAAARACAREPSRRPRRGVTCSTLRSNIGKANLMPCFTLRPRSALPIARI